MEKCSAEECCAKECFEEEYSVEECYVEKCSVHCCLSYIKKLTGSDFISNIKKVYLRNF